MKPKAYIILVWTILLCLPGLMFADKYAGEIFYLSPGVANQALGNTGITNGESVSAAWWNPALLALPGNRGLELMHSQQFDGLMQFNHISAILGTHNRLGLVITHIGIDDIALTKLENDSLPPSSTNQPFVYKTVNNNDLMAYFGIARNISPVFNVGITPKLAYRSLAGKSGYGFGADLGMLWDISPQFRLGVVARDFFTTQLIWSNGTQENVLPSLNPELAYTTRVTKHRIPIRLALGAETMLEGRKKAATFNAGAFSADFHAGLAVAPIPQLKVMAGYDVNSFTAGLGIYIQKISLEYAVKPGSGDDLGLSQRVSAGWRW
jgi:hypothetical protein